MRVAAASGGRWPAVVDALAIQDKEQLEMDREDGLVRERPAVALLKHLRAAWPEGEAFAATSLLIRELVTEHPEEWGERSPFGKPLTAQRLGRMLATSYGINSARLDREGPRGYTHASLDGAWRRMGISGSRRGTPEPVPVPHTPLSQTGASGASGETGALSTAVCGCGRGISQMRVAYGKPDCVDCERVAS